MPMVKKKEIDTYSDGYLYICDSSGTQNSFGAKINELKKSDLKNLQKLAFCEMSRRAQDLEFAESMSRKLTLKVKVPFRPDVTTDRKVLHENMLYDIFESDYDSDKRNLYLYLEEVRKIAE